MGRTVFIRILSQTGGHSDGWLPSGYDTTSPTWPGKPHGIVDGPDEMRRRVRELVRAGADQIKVCKAAVRAGIRSIEHGIYLDDEAIQMMIDRGTWLVPTLLAPQGVLDAVAAGIQIPPASLRKAHEVTEIHKVAVARAIDAGVKVAMGTDSGVTPHGHNLRERELMVRAGMSPVRAMLATTRNAADLLRVEDDRGSIGAGKRADLVIVDGDPFDYADLGDRVSAVYQDGQLVAGGL